MIRRPKLVYTLILALALVFTFSAVAAAQTISRPIEGVPNGVFLVEFRACGNIDAKGKGVSILDKAGNGVPFKVVTLDPEGVSILAVDPTGAEAPLTLQYGPKPAANAKIDESIQPSLILQVFPLTGGVRDFEDAIRITQSTRPIGTMPIQRINLGYNPFGSGDRFIALFSGVLQVESAGKYQLFSVNDDAAWVEIDGKVVIAHPRAVMVRDREKIPESATTVELSQGKHRLRYLLVANQGRPIAQLGRVAGKEVFMLPPSWFAQSKTATLGAAKVESAKPLIGFDVEEVDQINTEDGAYLRFNFRAVAPPPQGMKYRWDFGDGGAIGAAPASRTPAKPARSDDKPASDAAGSLTDVEHVFAVTAGSAGTWKVTLDLVDAKNAVVASAATSVRPGVETRYATIHNPDDLARFAGAISAADYSKATPEYMHSLYQLIQIAEQPALAAPLAEQFVKRFGTRGGAVVWDMKYTLAQALSRDEPERAEKLFLELALNAPDSWKGTTAAAEDIDLLLFRLGAKPDDVEQRISRMIQGRGSPRERALIRSRLGDYFRLTGKLDRAEEVYRQAQDESKKGEKMDAKQAAVLDRAYREQAQSLLAQRRFPAMRDTILQWEADFPLAKMGGDLPLLNGRYFQAIGDDPRAAIEFKTLLDLNPLHPSKPEIVYRLAESLERLGKNEEAKRLYRQVAKEFPNSPFAMPAANRAD